MSRRKDQLDERERQLKERAFRLNKKKQSLNAFGGGGGGGGVHAPVANTGSSSIQKALDLSTGLGLQNFGSALAEFTANRDPGNRLASAQLKDDLKRSRHVDTSLANESKRLQNKILESQLASSQQPAHSRAGIGVGSGLPDNPNSDYSRLRDAALQRRMREQDMLLDERFARRAEDRAVATQGDLMRQRIEMLRRLLGGSFQLGDLSTTITDSQQLVNNAGRFDKRDLRTTQRGGADSPRALLQMLG